MNGMSPQSHLPNLEWPADINSWEEWPDDIDVDYLLTRIGDLTLGTFKAILTEGWLDSDGADFIATAAAQREVDSIQRMKWCQEPLYNIDLWPEWEGDGFWEEYLHFMWNITEETTKMQGPAQIADALTQLMADPDIWQCPVAPAAILAQCSVSTSDVDSILKTFISAWSESPDSGFQYAGSEAIEADSTNISSCAPLMAIACLHPQAEVALAVKAATICSAAAEGATRLRAHLWQYVASCLVSPEERLDLIYPDVTWRDGFLSNPLSYGQPPIGAAQLNALVEVFLRHYESWEFDDPDDSTEILGDVATAMASRPELADHLLQALVATELSGVAEAALTNPAASVETRARAALFT
jgi:hypothetical protein